MTNKETGQKLISQARRILERDATEAWLSKDYNMVIRRAQEIVELSLKGALRILGVDYPKVHDVGSLFAEQVTKKNIPMTEDALDRIERISLWLTEARAPSFYGEKDYIEGDAKKALEDANFVLEAIKSAFQ